MQVLVQDHVTEGHDIPSFPGERLPSFSDEPDVPFGTPNLEHHGIGEPFYPDWIALDMQAQLIPVEGGLLRPETVTRSCRYGKDMTPLGRDIKTLQSCTLLVGKAAFRVLIPAKQTLSDRDSVSSACACSMIPALAKCASTPWELSYLPVSFSGNQSAAQATCALQSKSPGAQGAFRQHASIQLCIDQSSHPVKLSHPGEMVRQDLIVLSGGLLIRQRNSVCLLACW